MRRGDIEIVGEDPAAFDLDGFELPGTTMLNFIPSPVIRALRPWIWIYPEMSKERGCRAEKCALCVRSCPVRAIEMTGSGPVVDRKKCVECLCCHEVCPEDAVEVRLSWLASKFS
jgi:ferredoxin